MDGLFLKDAKAAIKISTTQRTAEDLYDYLPVSILRAPSPNSRCLAW